MNLIKKPVRAALIFTAAASISLCALFSAGAAEAEFGEAAAEEYRMEVSAESRGEAVAEKQYPEIESFENRGDGLLVKWSEYPGAARYRVYVRRGNFVEKSRRGEHHRISCEKRRQ